MSQTQEINEVKKAIMDHYHEGHDKHDYKYYIDILHDDWKFFMFNRDGNLLIVDKDQYCSWYDPKDYDENLTWETEFLYVDTTGNVGSAKIRLECEKVKYIDYFNLVRLEDKWWIVNKVCHPTRKIQ
ncbi:MAG: nuclear transport factor 2 family protein [Candidatus Heimdallarchaeota archaeon]|nr:nuclear transport factor 2 family protein [Candidatus Heimdallarchaeota archaeon]MCK5144047.1 nuclear transport factor 2 family protein [Candidatus Heimdallarchaeota archaeon]